MQACRSLCVWGILLTSPAASSRAGDWPQFRGPAGDGSSSELNLAVEWGPSKNVVWKLPIAGSGWSSPVVGGGRIYLTSAVPVKGSGAGDVSLRALCLSADTGKTIWDTEVLGQESKGAPRIHGKNSHASPTPVLCDGRLFVHFGHQGTACLDLDGKVLWRNRSLTYKPVHGNGGSPICVDDLLVYSADGGDTRFVIALDARTGAVRWKTARAWESGSKFSFSTPLAITVHVRKQIVSAGSDAVAAYDPVDGKEIWRVRYAGGYSVIPKPIYANGLVYVCTGYAFPVLLAIRHDGRGDVTDTHVAWKAKKGVPNTPSILVVGNELYEVTDGGLATCLDSATGSVLWQQRIGGHYSASPLFAAGRIYFQSEEGVGTVIKAGRKFEQVAKNDLDERSLASYALADGALFIRTEHHLYRVQPR
jgi:outer membrane protein assembly factor BamB